MELSTVSNGFQYIDIEFIDQYADDRWFRIDQVCMMDNARNGPDIPKIQLYRCSQLPNEHNWNPIFVKESNIFELEKKKTKFTIRINKS